MNDDTERRLMVLANQIFNWDKVDAIQILPVLNEFEELLNDKKYQPGDFGITRKTIPSAYMPKALKESGQVVLVDKNKQCIYGESAPYQVKKVANVKASLALIKKLK